MLCETKKQKLIGFLTLGMFCLSMMLGCQSREIKLPDEFRAHSININPSQCPSGFGTWSWGSVADSAIWRDRLRIWNLDDFMAAHPEWQIKNKSGVVKYNIKLLPPRFQNWLDQDFDAVNLIYHPETGLWGWERLIDNRSHKSDSLNFENLFNVLSDSLSNRLGSPHTLEAKSFGDGIERTGGALWKSNNLYLTIESLQFNGKYQQIAIICRRYK